MKHFQVVVEVHAQPERVWAVLRDVERWPEWTASMRKIERLDGGPFAVGSRVRVHQPKLLPAVCVVTRLEDGRGFTWVARSPGVQSVGGHWLEASPRGTVVTLSIEFSGLLGGLTARLLRGLIERYVNLEAAGLKARSESASADPLLGIEAP